MKSVLVIDNSQSQRIKSALENVEANVFLSDNEIQAINSVEQMQPSVVMLNYDFCKDQTLEYISLILQVSSNSKVIVIVDGLSKKTILNCLIAGAKGYQDINKLEFYANRLIEVVDAGEAWVSRHLVSLILDSLRAEYVVE